MKQLPTVTVIIPVYKVEGVLQEVLESAYSQTYPIREIILIDNRSPDRSVAVAKKFAAIHKKIPIKILKRKKTYGISDSYNLGAKIARSEYIVTLHSDSMLPSKYELGRLMEPFVVKKNVYLAAMPLVVHRKKEWQEYSFWQKCLFAQVVGRQEHSLNGKFDAYRRSVFLSLGGYDTKHFNRFIGAEDADMNFRLSSQGEIAKTRAKVVHLHGRDPAYALNDWVARRRFLSKAYARQLELHWKDMGISIVPFLVKPGLVVMTLLSYFYPLLVILVVIFPFWYMRNMFMDPASRSDPHILLLPFIVLYLVFAETVWLLQGLFLRDSRV